MIEGVYFFYFIGVAINMAYMPAHLCALGLSGRQMSVALSVQPTLALLLPLAWAWLADRTHRHDWVLRLLAAGACVGFAPLAFARGSAARSFALVLASYLAYAMFAVGISAMLDALAVARVRGGASYGRIRMWGSLGYASACMGVGVLMSIVHADLESFLPAVIVWIALGVTFLVSWQVGGTGEPANRPRFADVTALLSSSSGLLAILIAGALHWICMSPYNVFFGVYLHGLGISPMVPGMAYGVGVVAEMLVLLHFNRLHARFGLDTLLASAFIASGLRWLAVAEVRSPSALILLQLLHGMTFGMFWGAAIARVAATVPAPLRATGQALLLMSINLGGTIGNLVTGAVYGVVGPQTLFGIAAAGELAPLIVVWWARHGLRARPDALAPD
jgi:MFS transporter, PPP family, 3-phenylpropionic acid transporter